MIYLNPCSIKKQGFCEGEVFGGMSNNEVLKLLRITKALR